MSRKVDALFAAAVAIAFFAPAIFLDEMPTQRDFIHTFVPYRLYAASCLRDGRLPLWSPEPGLGAPFLANYQSSVLYPPSLIVLAAPNARGIGLYLALHLWVAGFGTIVWMRSRGLSGASSWFAAVVMMVGGMTISIAQGNHLAVAAWIPIVVVLGERVVREGGAGPFAALTTIMALQLLAGAPETFMQSAALVAASGLVATRRSERPFHGLALLGVAAILATALAAVQLVPTAEYYLQTERGGGLPRAEGMAESVSPATFATLVFPHRVVDGVLEPPIDGRIPVFWSIYLGLAPLLLAPVGLTTRGGRAWGAVAALACLLALGRHTPVYPLLYDSFPWFFGAFRYPMKFLVTGHVAAVVVAAHGFERLLGGLGGRRTWVAAAVVVVAIADLFEVHAPAMLFTPWPTLLRSPAPELLAAAANDRLFHYERKREGLANWLPRFFYGEDWRRRHEMIWASLAANISLVYRVRYLNNQDSFASGTPALKTFYRALREMPVESGIHALRSFDVRVLEGEPPLASPEIELIRSGDDRRMFLYRVVDPAPRVYLARRVIPAASVAATMAAIAEPSFRPGVDATIEDPPAATGGALAGGRVKIVRDDPEELSIDVEIGGPGILVVGDAFFPGWVAEVDGRETAILRANGLARAVALEAGSHDVRFRYRPESFRRGLGISIGAALAFAATLALVARAAKGRVR